MDHSIDTLFEELVLTREEVWPKSIPFTDFAGSIEYWNWFGKPFPVPYEWNPKNLRDIIYYNKDGLRHKIFGPAYISKLYDIEIWYKDGLMHRDNGPAYRHRKNYVWFKEGKLHNLEGPAVVEGGGPHQYWIDGIKFTKKQYEWEINRRIRKGLLK